MVSTRLLSGIFALATVASTLLAAAPAAAQTMDQSAPTVQAASAVAAPQPGAAQDQSASEVPGVWRATDEWSSAFVGWDTDAGGPAIQFQQR